MWGKIVGGIVGGAVGGPLGAVIGASLGHMVDSAASGESIPSLDASCTYTRLRDGIQIEFRLPTIEDGAGAFVHLSQPPNGTAFLKAAHPSLGDDDGDLVLVSAVSDHRAAVFIPNGAVSKTPLHAPIKLHLTVLAPPPSEGELPKLLGKTVFDLDCPIVGTYRTVFHWRPLIGLLMAVARADGHLDRSEIRSIRNTVAQGIGAPPSEDDLLRQVLKEEPSASIEALCAGLRLRCPGLDPMDLFVALAEVAHADGRIDPAEVAMIRTIFIEMGGHPDAWADLGETLRLEGRWAGTDGQAHRRQEEQRRSRRSTRDPDTLVLEECYALLELEVGASADDIRRAHRRKVARYHPDRYQNLPPEMVAVAETMTQRLNEARDVLLAHTAR